MGNGEKWVSERGGEKTSAKPVAKLAMAMALTHRQLCVGSNNKTLTLTPDSGIYFCILRGTGTGNALTVVLETEVLFKK